MIKNQIRIQETVVHFLHKGNKVNISTSIFHQGVLEESDIEKLAQRKINREMNLNLIDFDRYGFDIELEHMEPFEVDGEEELQELLERN